MSVDLSEFDQLTSKGRKAPCKVRAALDALSEKDAVILEAAIEAKKDFGAIEEWCRRRNQKVSISALTSHDRKKSCSCHG